MLPELLDRLVLTLFPLLTPVQFLDPPVYPCHQRYPWFFRSLVAAQGRVGSFRKSSMKSDSSDRVDSSVLISACSVFWPGDPGRGD
jgi:hypothetical protein